MRPRVCLDPRHYELLWYCDDAGELAAKLGLTLRQVYLRLKRSDAEIRAYVADTYPQHHAASCAVLNGTLTNHQALTYSELHKAITNAATLAWRVTHSYAARRYLPPK